MQTILQLWCKKLSNFFGTPCLVVIHNYWYKISSICQMNFLGCSLKSSIFTFFSVLTVWLGFRLERILLLPQLPQKLTLDTRKVKIYSKNYLPTLSIFPFPKKLLLKSIWWLHTLSFLCFRFTYSFNLHPKVTITMFIRNSTKMCS